MADRLPFEDWLRQLSDITGNPLSNLDAEAWRPYYDDGFSPEEAFAEDCTNG